MIISLNWLKQYTDINLPVDELATLIGARLVEIEEIIDLGKKYQGIVIAKVINIENHPNADNLHICKIDDNGKVKDIQRDSDGLVQVICGAPNVHEGMIVAWLPPGVTLPESYDKEPLVIEARELRGELSHGMLASAKELELGDNHDGLLEIDEPAQPGDNFADIYELDDYLLDIENKSLTHRPDGFGIIGFAREVAAIRGKKFQSPNWLKDIKAPSGHATNPAPAVTIDDSELASRYQAVVLEGVRVNQQSSVRLQTYLARVGMRPISAIVDVTNYFMMLTGQPLHAFDYDKLAALNGGVIDIHVRAGDGKETLKLLDGRVVTLQPQDVVIANGKTPVALAGAMGGVETEVDEKTTKVLLESATFNLYNLRGTQMRHGIFSEAITRFTKGQPAELTAPVLNQAVTMLEHHTDLRVVSKIADEYPNKHKAPHLQLSTEKINDILGSEFTRSDITRTLQDVEFDVESDKDLLNITVPWWRADIHIDEDIAEEIGRINGYDNIEPSLPTRPFEASDVSELESLKQKLHQVLARAGANDILSYSFVHGDLLKSAGQKPEGSYALVNALSPHLQYYRQSLTPSLLELVHPNIKAGFNSFALFEINKTHIKGKVENDLPIEFERLALVFAADAKTAKELPGSPYFYAKRYLSYLLDQFGLFDVAFEPLDKKTSDSNTTYFVEGRAATIRVGDKVIGRIGEYTNHTSRSLKLPQYCAGFEIGLIGLLEAMSNNQKPIYKPLSKYPGTSQDITLQVGQKTMFSEVQKVIEQALQEVELEWQLTPLGIYQPNVDSTKNITFRLQLTDHKKTIIRDQANRIVTEIGEVVGKQLGAKII